MNIILYENFHDEKNEWKLDQINKNFDKTEIVEKLLHFLKTLDQNSDINLGEGGYKGIYENALDFLVQTINPQMGIDVNKYNL